MGLSNLFFLGLAVLLLGCLTLLVLALTRGSSKCPHCECPKVRPSFPTLVDKLLSFLYLRPYRCHACRSRFYAKRRRRTHEHSRGATAGSS
jgi:hypothetical protein